MRVVVKSAALNDTIKNGINGLFSVQFDYSDRRVPLGICASCQRGIYEYNKSGTNSRKLVLVHRNFDHIIIPPATRSEQVCTCEICTIVAKGPVKAGYFRKFAGSAKKNIGASPRKFPHKNWPSPQKTKY